MARPIKNEGCHRLQSEVEFTDGWITDAPLQGKRILVLGAGQTKREVIALGLANKVTAIDLDVGPTGWRPGPYVQLFRQNGPVRTAKTIGRKVLGIDHRFTKSLMSTDRHHDPYGTTLVAELATLRAADELVDYADEELLAVNLRSVWTKPVSVDRP